MSANTTTTPATRTSSRGYLVRFPTITTWASYRQFSINNGQFHTFGVSWGPSGYNFYVNNSLTYPLTQGNSISMVPEYLLLSTVVIRPRVEPESIPAGGYGSLGTSSNAKMMVDYVRCFYATPDRVRRAAGDRADRGAGVGVEESEMIYEP